VADTAGNTGLANTFLLDEKTIEKNQEKNKLLRAG